MYNNATIKKRAKKILALNYWWIFLTALLFGYLSNDISFNVGLPSGLKVIVQGDYKNLNSIEDTFRDAMKKSMDQNSSFGKGYKFGRGIGGDYENDNDATIEEDISGITDEIKEDPSAKKILIIMAVLIGFAVLIGLIIGLLIKAFIINPVKVGLIRWYILNRNEKQKNVSAWGYGFKDNYKNIVKVMFLKDLYELLWGLLFIIPGIVKSYEYKMIPYMLAENSAMTSEEAFDRTKSMMTGRKRHAFYLDLSFIGWRILVSFIGILGIFFVNPYYYLSNIEFYIAACMGDSYYDDMTFDNSQQMV